MSAPNRACAWKTSRRKRCGRKFVGATARVALRGRGQASPLQAIILEYILIAILLAAVFAFIAYPILNPTREETSQPDALDALVAQRDSAYAALRDLDFDFQLGKLSPNDYQALRERYKAHAATVLQQIDALSGSGTDARIEGEVAQLRAAKNPTDDAIEREVARLRANKGTRKVI